MWEEVTGTERVREGKLGKNIVTLARLDPVGALKVKRAVPLEGSLEGENGGECDCYLLGFSRKIPNSSSQLPTIHTVQSSHNASGTSTVGARLL